MRFFLKTTFPLAFIALCTLTLFITSCKEDEPEPIPAAPSQLSATAISTDQIDLEWTDNASNETKFIIERKEDGADFSMIGTSLQDVASFSDKSVLSNITYVYRVYAVNSENAESPFSNEVTVSSPGVPILSTTGLSEITAFSAISGGAISNDGGSVISARGVVVSNDPAPTLQNGTVIESSDGTDTFASSIAGLLWSTTYYVRSYATNSTGTGYGDELSFTTLQPSISTDAVSNIEYFSASSGGTVGSDGGYEITGKGVVWSKEQDPTIDLTTKTDEGAGSGVFTSSLIELLSNETYNIRAYAISEGGVAYGQNVEFNSKALEDKDGNLYSVVQIGTQLWMADNLETGTYNDGIEIPNITDNLEWDALTTGAYSWFDNNKESNTGLFGALYNWYTVETGKLCPTGWHVPTDSEWDVLSNFLGGNSVAGGKMKTTGTDIWSAPNTDATNESGFSGLPGGARIGGGQFPGRGSNGDWWSSTEKDTPTAYPRDLQADTGALNIELNGTPKSFGFSVRCILD